MDRRSRPGISRGNFGIPGSRVSRAPRNDWKTKTPMFKPGPITAKPLSVLLSDVFSDAYAKQGFAARELVTRWAEIAGPEVAAHSEPLKIQWPRPVEGQRQAPLSRRNPPKSSGAPNAAAVAEIAETLSAVEDEELRAALARLGASIKQ